MSGVNHVLRLQFLGPWGRGGGLPSQNACLHLAWLKNNKLVFSACGAMGRGGRFGGVGGGGGAAEPERVPPLVSSSCFQTTVKRLPAVSTLRKYTWSGATLGQLPSLFSLAAQ